jgi:hypothetical protein
MCYLRHLSHVSASCEFVGDDLLQPLVGNALGVVITQGGVGNDGEERPSTGSMAKSGMDAATLNTGRIWPRDKVSNDHASYG